MVPAAGRAHRESRSFLEDAIAYLQATVSREEVQTLLTNDQAWETVVAEAQLSRDEADVLCEILNELKEDKAVGGKDKLAKDLLGRYRVRFLKEFPQVKMELEERIGKLHALADKVDKIHKDCTISHVVANSTSTVSGILTILGLTLAPVTAGVGLVLSGIGIGLGAAAAVTSVSTSIVDHSSRLSAKAEASSLASTSIDKGEVIAKALRANTFRLVSVSENVIQASEIIGKNIRAIKLAKADPRLMASATRFMTTGSLSVRSGLEVQEAFGGTALAMTKGARVMGVAATGFFLLMDVVSLVRESKHLHEGAKAEVAVELRQEARKLQEKLEELTRIHASLQ
ncbi:apolipoprotein L3-like [Choloepus didactylus]|uniref:apolipoprotein L3-like n=1 Tax=Choloepus didactylus TaxID=27675 RepID=UPI00189CE856|nr:apolipoprotein L3-like [Choloepus didactylus]XP_037702674.1 apolipoprotein L3-like [Choloepus didactylus]XP_037702675.1 apolipoprotein L3-like [Choloepus didactylus]XP_037702676.1 apolipoprotein L3-like [Choloepus didactylus]XP_037702677.1 apolipoprotein L3-like [Choloepus didactylus]XP_037702678.1 apolipoprotein L3-like [Choloepus didactylus]XP_037702679.1 apolipoprotein L3-like [Choloepus didactylus]XP_037702680.1 apolipoprotein L3-like [Choloepus didactylus]